MPWLLSPWKRIERTKQQNDTMTSYFCGHATACARLVQKNHDSKVHGVNMGPIWGRQDPGGPHVGPMNSAIWEEQQSMEPQDYLSGLIWIYWWIPSQMVTDADPVSISWHKHCLSDLCSVSFSGFDSLAPNHEYISIAVNGERTARKLLPTTQLQPRTHGLALITYSDILYTNYYNSMHTTLML